MMNVFTGRLLTVIAGFALLMVACGDNGTGEVSDAAQTSGSTGEVTEGQTLEGELNLVGSTTVQPLAEVLAASF
ncbi:MAG: hypothetical protein JXR55_04675, partial [Candidatus Fermentibacteraceae bacterium]|nr:hypothetical protein [Candidatus Fermentibacteraceae bacterium]